MPTLEETLKAIKNPEIRKLVIDLQNLPEYLDEERRKKREHDEFCRYVWEDACTQAGLINKFKFNS